MMTIVMTMKWEPAALAKYTKMLELIPIFHRRIAQEVVNKKAEINAQERSAGQVEEGDIVDAFMTEVPKAFSSLMVRIMDEVGFDYSKYTKA